MEHKTIKAAATATDQGEFTAIAAAYTVDRMDEQIQQGAFEKTITRWQESGKNIPLHWDHSGKPQDIIGVVHPNEMREADEGLYVKGQLDLEGSEVAREAWRLMKSNSIGLSFGYLVNDSTEDDGVKTLTDLDVFEISITPAPVNPDTRVLEMKSVEEMRSGYDKLAIGLMAVGVNPDATVEPPPSEEKAEDDLGDLSDEERDLVKAHRAGELTTIRFKPGGGVMTATTANTSNLTQPIEEAEDEDPAEKPGKSPAQDPLRKGHDDLALDLMTRGIDLAEPPQAEAKPTGDLRSLEELRRESYDLMLESLTGSEKT